MNKYLKHSKIVITFATSLFVTGVCNASELQFRFINPSFGGNPSNSAHLLGLAGPQNQFQPKNEQKSPIEEFNDRLQRSLLGRITTAVTKDIVDEDGNIQPGSFETLDYTINVVDLGNGKISIETIDKVTGEKTVIELSSAAFSN